MGHCGGVGRLPRGCGPPAPRLEHPQRLTCGVNALPPALPALPRPCQAYSTLLPLNETHVGLAYERGGYRYLTWATLPLPRPAAALPRPSLCPGGGQCGRVAAPLALVAGALVVLVHLVVLARWCYHGGPRGRARAESAMSILSDTSSRDSAAAVHTDPAVLRCTSSSSF